MMTQDGSGGRMDGTSWPIMVPDVLDELGLDKAGSRLTGLAQDGFGRVGAARVGAGLLGQAPACLDKLKADSAGQGGPR